MPISTARLAQRHAELGASFYDVVAPAAFPRTIPRYRNQAWAERIGLGDLTDAEWIGHFGRFEPLHAKLAAIAGMAEAYGTQVAPPRVSPA